jgi:HD-GYP domain-containing protein (c-di-GMP phosphodiesterase class II)
LAVTNAYLYESLKTANDELASAYEETLGGWAAALELRDREVHGHTARVQDLTIGLAKAMGVGEDELVNVRRGTILHDIGKMVVPDAILHKPGPLTDDEWAIMRRHPGAARDMLARIDFLFPALDIPYCHHERWDGTGYPQGLAGTAIPLSARVFAIVDVYDALTSDRPYRPAWSREKALEHIRDESGKHFDPDVVDAFFSLIDQGH